MSHAGIELGLASREYGVVDGDTRVLHDGEARGHGHLQIGEQPHGVAVRHLLVEHGLQREQDGGPASTGQVGDGHGVRGEGLQVEGALGPAPALARVRLLLADDCKVDSEPALGESVDVVAALLGPAQISCQ